MGPTTARRPTLRKKLVTAPSSWPPAWHQRDQDDVTSSKLCHWSSVKIQERKSQVTIKEGNLRGKSVRCRRSVSHATADRGEPQQCRVPRGVSSLAGGIFVETQRIFCAVRKLQFQQSPVAASTLRNKKVNKVHPQNQMVQPRAHTHARTHAHVCVCACVCAHTHTRTHKDVVHLQ